jgi:hypothetical protein
MEIARISPSLKISLLQRKTLLAKLEVMKKETNRIQPLKVWIFNLFI